MFIQIPHLLIHKYNTIPHQQRHAHHPHRFHHRHGAENSSATAPHATATYNIVHNEPVDNPAVLLCSLTVSIDL